jgi:hypothetical protein
MLVVCYELMGGGSGDKVLGNQRRVGKKRIRCLRQCWSLRPSTAGEYNLWYI